MNERKDLQMGVDICLLVDRVLTSQFESVGGW